MRNKHHRVSEVDAIRAFALLGVLVMNLRSVSGLRYLSEDQLAALQGPVDVWLDHALAIFVDKKFLSAFSFLFGLSFTLLLERKGNRDDFILLYTRRLLGLACFGVLNILFFYWGDILLTYAALGALLLLQRRFSERMLLTGAALLLLGAPIGFALSGSVKPGGVDRATAEQALNALSTPHYFESLTFGVKRYLMGIGGTHAAGKWDYFNVLGLFVLGVWSGRKGLFQDIGKNTAIFRWIAVTGITIGTPLAAAEALLPSGSSLAVAMRVGIPLLGIGYIAGAALLFHCDAGRPLRTFLAPTGRMALTNYLLYGFFGQLLFYGWGFGLIGHVSTGELILLSAVVYASLATASWWWMTSYRFGPLEWVWRCFTYMQYQPIRKKDKG